MAEHKKTVEATVRTIRRATRKKYTAEEKMRIVLEGLRGQTKIWELCRREGSPRTFTTAGARNSFRSGRSLV
jgi:transposase